MEFKIGGPNMNKKTFLLLVNICLMSILSISPQYAQVAQVKDILKDPASFDQEEVEVTGIVIQYIEATEKTTSHYYLKDDYGAIIKVHTAESKPETNVKYRVNGILYIDAATELPFISEKSKSKVVEPPPLLPTWWEKNW